MNVTQIIKVLTHEELSTKASMITNKDISFSILARSFKEICIVESLSEVHHSPHHISCNIDLDNDTLDSREFSRALRKYVLYELYSGIFRMMDVDLSIDSA